MNFHIYVIIITIIFYFVLRLFKKSILNNTNNPKKKQSQFIYILFIPVIMYTYKYFSDKDNNKELTTNIQNKIQRLKTASTSTSDLLTKPYPESSI